MSHSEISLIGVVDKIETQEISNSIDNKTNSLLNQKLTRIIDHQAASSLQESQGRNPKKELTQDKDRQDQSLDPREENTHLLCPDPNQELNQGKSRRDHRHPNF